MSAEGAAPIDSCELCAALEELDGEIARLEARLDRVKTKMRAVQALVAIERLKAARKGI